MSSFEVQFLTRRGCHLCEAARPVVHDEVERLGGSMVVKDVDSDDELVRDYGLRVPVVLAEDGSVLAEGIVVRKELRRSLRGLS